MGDCRCSTWLFLWGNLMNQVPGKNFRAFPGAARSRDRARSLFFLAAFQTMLLAVGCGNASGQPVTLAAGRNRAPVSGAAKPATEDKKFDVTPAEAAKLVEDNKAFIVDVREQDEILTDGMAKPAKWLSMEEIQTRGNRYEDALRTWPKDTKLIFYCVSGRRAKIAADHFKELGYTTLNMGRFKDWQDAGLPTRAKP